MLANRVRFAALPALLCLLQIAGPLSAEPAAIASTGGLPVTRFHSFDEIGNVSAGVTLGFDPIGRVAAVQDNTYAVLNDRSWVHLVEASGSADMMTHVLLESVNSGYYGSVGSWGRVTQTPEGKLHPVSLRPPECPVWVQATSFTSILPVGDGVFFSGWTGAVYWDRTTGEHIFFELPELLCVFAMGGEIYISSAIRGILKVNLATRSLHQAYAQHVDAFGIERTADLSDGRVLGSTKRRGIFVLDGTSPKPWAPELSHLFGAGVASICRLHNGVAIAVEDTGLFILSEEGEILSAFTSAEYHAIRVVAAREPGILWLATDLGIHQVFYGSRASVIDRRVGLPIMWPQVVRSGGETIVSSYGRLYQAVQDSSNQTVRFELVPGQAPDGSWAIGALGDQLLTGNKGGVYVRTQSGIFTRVVGGIDVARLVMVAPDFCYALGTYEITALRYDGKTWSECAERVPGFGYPSIVHATRTSAWIELGANRVARVSFRDGRLVTRLIDTFPWDEPRWVNVSVLGDLVALCGPERERIFFDESIEAFRPAPEMEKLLNLSPFWIARAALDSSGTIWASHDHGVLKLVRTEGGYQVDPGGLETIRDRYPIIRVLDDRDVWIATGSTLYHVQSSAPNAVPGQIKPVLESMVDARTGRLLAARDGGSALGRLSYAQNSLSLRFFAGTYSVRSPTYLYRMRGPSTTWSLADADSPLTLPDLKEGRYQLDIQLTDNRRPIGTPLALSFEIAPPWFRTLYAYFAYGLGGLASIYGLIFLSLRRTRAHNAQLAVMVQERTQELKLTMEKLNEEARNAATLAERDRLAGEIHDSLQQGLSGLMLHLDATLKLPGISPDLRARLGTARNMVSFTRHEVQHAVWDMESPLLENADLGEAIRKMASLINSSAARVEIALDGTAHPLSSAKMHHLLRIAQEAMANSVRHGAAETISVTLTYEPGVVSLTVTDDGRGFDLHEVMARGAGHFGLRGMRSRAGKINGDLEVFSEPGRGTSVIIRVPVSEKHIALTHDTLR